MNTPTIRAMSQSATQRKIRAEKLAEAIRIPTVADPDQTPASRGILRKWQERMVELFPHVHDRLTSAAPDEYRLVYRWEPREGVHGGAAPILLMAHYDVVPADGEGWKVPPFSGEIRDGAVWGRGALDNKLSHIAILQAVEELLSEGYAPARPVHLAFGGDEEIGGSRGARRIAEEYLAEGVRFAFSLDEGAIVARDMLPGLPGAVGLIGCGEKGHTNIRVTARSRGGHASNPPRVDGGSILAVALTRALRRPFPVRRTATVDRFIVELGRASTGPAAAILRGYPVTAPVVRAAFSRTPETDSMIRSSRTVTMMGGSDAPNVLPREAWVNLNIRLLPGDTIAGVTAELRRRIGRIRGPVEIAVEAAPGWDHNEAPPESPSSGPAYDAIANAIGSVWPGIPVIPYLVTATTDSRHYAAVSDATYRFLPIEIGREDLAGIHGVDEHVSLENVDRAVEFYRHLIENSGGIGE
jgi:carboxypeptidase PM20D1